MAHRITQKFLHPILKELTKENDYSDLVQSSKSEYQKNYLDKYKRKPDHVEDNDTTW